MGSSSNHASASYSLYDLCALPHLCEAHHPCLKNEYNDHDDTTHAKNLEMHLCTVITQWERKQFKFPLTVPIRHSFIHVFFHHFLGTRSVPAVEPCMRLQLWQGPGK